MKSTTFAIGLLAGVASAAVPQHMHHPHPRFLHQHWRRSNETYPTTAVESSVAAVTEGASTTLTVAVTETHTITSCAPTITNCPVNASNGTAVVTQVVDITTIVCPVTEVPAISSSIVSDYTNGVITGGVTSTVQPTGSPSYPTHPAPPPPGATVTASTMVHDQTLTMTVGPSSSRSVLVTTIRSTYTEMVTVKVPGGGHGGNAPPADDQTTTTTMTTTGTRTVTVESPTTSTEASPEQPTEAGNGTPYPTKPIEGAHGGSNVGTGNDAVCVPVTVTVTHQVAPQTVYVTMPAAPSPTKPTAVEVPEDNTGDDTEEGDDDEEVPDECPTPSATTSASAEDVTVTSTATVIPYPTGASNGTLPVFPTGGMTKPVESYPTIAVKPRDVFGRN